MKMSGTPYYRAVLKKELTERMEKNPRYSLRAYAKALGIDPSSLSRILSGRRFITEKLAARVFKVLDLNLEEQERFLKSIALTKRSEGVGRISSELRKLLETAPVEIQRDLTMDVFKVIADWHHAAILELAQTDGFKSEPRWMASKLGIGESECKLAIERLVELELLVEEEGRYKKADKWVDTADKTKTSSAHRKRQKEILLKSIESLENDPIDVRNHSSITLPIDPAKIPEAKKMIGKFMWNLTRFLGSDQKKQVYELTVNLFPISKPISPEKT